MLKLTIEAVWCRRVTPGSTTVVLSDWDCFWPISGPAEFEFAKLRDTQTHATKQQSIIIACAERCAKLSWLMRSSTVLLADQVNLLLFIYI